MNPTIFENAVRDYTVWYLINAVGWIGFGVWLTWVALRAARRHDPRAEQYSATFPMRPIYYLVAGIGLIFVFCNVPTLLKPRAYAIHGVLKDSQHHYPVGITITNTP